MFSRIKNIARRVRAEIKAVGDTWAHYRDRNTVVAIAEETAHNAKEAAVTAAVTFTAMHVLGLTFTLYGTAAVINLPLAITFGLAIQIAKVIGRI